MEQLTMCYEFSDRESVLLSCSGILYLTKLRHRTDLNHAFRQLGLFVSIETDQPDVARVYTHLDIPNV